MNSRKIKPEPGLHAPSIRLPAIFLAIAFLLSGCLSLPKLFSAVQPSPTPTALPTSTPNPTKTPFATPPLATTSVPQTVQYSTLRISSNCTYTVYFWESHPERWLVENIIIGRLSYDKSEALSIMSDQNQENAYPTLRQFFAAALNILKGADPSSIESDIDNAGAWLNAHPLGSELSEADLQKAVELTSKLKSFNTGEIGPGPCQDEPNTPTPAFTPTPTVTPTPTPGPAVIFPPTDTRKPTHEPQKGPTGTPVPQPTATQLSQPSPTNPPPTNPPPTPKPTNTQELTTPTSAPTEAPTTQPPEPTTKGPPTPRPKPTKETTTPDSP